VVGDVGVVAVPLAEFGDGGRKGGDELEEGRPWFRCASWIWSRSRRFNHRLKRSSSSFFRSASDKWA
jgi:hypothetical protein